MSHSHHHSAENRHNSAFLTAVTVNTAFVILQIIYAIKANSMSLLSDAAHNFGDVFGLMLAWGASWLLTLPARRRYSYGYKRITIVAAIINALLLGGSSAIIAFESLTRFHHLTTINTRIVISVALAGILVNGSTALLFMRDAGHDLNIRGAFLHLAGDALISFGVVMAGLLVHLTGYLWIDPLTGLLIVLVILWGTAGLLRDSISLILDAIPRHIDHHGIDTFLKNLPGVTAVHDLHIWGLSTREVALTAHLVMPSKKPTDAELREICKKLKDQYRINHPTLQIESGDLPCENAENC